MLTRKAVAVSKPRAIDDEARRVGEIIKKRCTELGISGAELARRVGIEQPSMSNIMNGLTKQSPHLAKIADVLGLPTSTLIPSLTAQNYPVDNVAGMRQQRDFPVYFMERGKGEGNLVITSEAVEWVERPSLLATVKNSFGICVYGDAMAPAYEAGDIIFVHPYQPPVPGSDIVLRPTEKDDDRICLGRLVDETPTAWKIMHHKGSKHITLNKGEWGRCDRIVGKYNRR